MKINPTDILAAWAEDSTIREAAALKFAIHCLMVKQGITELRVTQDDIKATIRDDMGFEAVHGSNGVMVYRRFAVERRGPTPGADVPDASQPAYRVNTGDLKDPTVDEPIPNYAVTVRGITPKPNEALKQVEDKLAEARAANYRYFSVEGFNVEDLFGGGLQHAQWWCEANGVSKMEWKDAHGKPELIFTLKPK